VTLIAEHMAKKGGDAIYAKRSDRGCTDVLCLLLLLATWGAMISVTVMSVIKEPDIVNILRYPRDEYGQFCGQPGSATEDLPRALYPTLDADFASQVAEASSLPFWEYYKLKFTSLCVAECPDGLSLSESALGVYGGADYPTGDAVKDDSSWNYTTPEFTYTFRTANLYGRCLPLGNTFAAPEQVLCVSPNCSYAMSALAINVTECAVIPSRADERETWEVCAEDTGSAVCDAQEKACEVAVRVETAQTFLPADGDETTDALTRKLAQYVALTLRMWDSIAASWRVVLALGVALPVALGFIYAVLLSLFAGVVIWSLLALLLGGMVLLSAILCVHAGWLDVPTDAYSTLEGALGAVASNDTAAMASAQAESLLVPAGSLSKDWYVVFAVLSIAATLVMLLWFCASWRAIRRAVAITEEATKVFSTLPSLMIWPFVELGFQAAWLVYGVFGLAVISYPPVWGGGSTTTLLALAHVAGTLWAIQFIKACDYTTMAAAVAYWFVTTNVEKDGCCGAAKCCRGWSSGLGFPKLLDAAWTVSTRHLGSLAFGSACIAICQLLRLVLYAVHAATKQTKADRNFLVRFLFKCAMCALWCLEKCVEFVSYYAYVHIAIDGTSFCVACRDTFGLIVKYPAQTAINSLVKRLLCGVLLGLSTPFLASACCFLYLDSLDDFTASHSPLYSAAAVFVIAWFVASGISNVFEAILDTVYLCAFQDMDQNSPPRYLSASMRSALGIDAASEEAGGSAEYFKKASDRHQQAGGAVPVAREDGQPPMRAISTSDGIRA